MKATSRDRVKLHPMAILSISDHYSRTRARGGGPVMGCFFGTYENGTWEAIGAFGVPAVPKGGDHIIDQVYLCKSSNVSEQSNSARDHYVSQNGVFPEFDIIGWYRSGDGSPTATDMESAEIVRGAAYEAGVQ